MAISCRMMAVALALAAPMGAPGVAWPMAGQAAPVAAQADAERMAVLERELIALMESGQLREAHARLDALIDLEIAAYGPHDWRVANSLSFRASLLEQEGNLQGAEAARRQEVATRREGNDVRALADAQVSLAVNLTLQNRLSEALTVLEQVAALSLTPDTADVRLRRALTEAHILTAVGREGEALEVLIAADAQATTNALPQGAQLLPARVAHAVAVALTDAGRPVEAEEPARRACAASTSQPELAAAACFSLAAVLDDLGRTLEASPWAQQALEAERASGADILVQGNKVRAARLAAGGVDHPEYERYLRLALDMETAAGVDRAEWGRAANDLGVWLTQAGRAGESEPLLRRAVAAYSASGGPDARDAVTVRGNWIDALAKSGQAAEAEREAVALLPHVLDRPDLMGVRHAMLDALARRPAESERLAAAMAADYETADGDTHAHRVSLYGRLANLASDRFDWPTALEWRGKALERERAQGTVGRDLMIATAYYGRAALETRDYVLADRYLTEARRLMGAYEDADPDVRMADRLYLARHLSSAALYQGREEEADRLSQEALDIARARTGAVQDQISALIVRSDLMTARSDLPAAEAYLNQALALARNEDDGGDSAAVVEGQLSALWKMQGRYDEAETAMRNVIDHVRRTYGAEALATAVPLKNLALLLVETGRVDRALPLLEQTAAIEAAWLPPEHPERMLTQVRLATLMTDRGEAEAALALLEGVADQSEARLGAGHWVSLQARERLGWALARMERYQEAGEHFQRTVLAVEDTRGPDSFDLMGPLQALAYALYMDGRYEETLAVMRRSATVGEAGGGRWRGSLSTVKSNLGVTLMVLGRPREALEPLRQAAELSRQGVVSRSGEDRLQIDPDRFAFRKLVEALFRTAQSG